jgi:hypothetical protein
LAIQVEGLGGIMLVVEFTINFAKTIIELHIHRAKTAKNGYHIYRVVKPEGFADIEIKHHYDKGAFELVLRVMKELKKRGFNPRPAATWKEMSANYEFDEDDERASTDN